jgi:hypothetical protein
MVKAEFVKTGCRESSSFDTRLISNSLIFPSFWLSLFFHGQHLHVQALLQSALVQRLEFLYFGSHAIFLTGK